MKLNFNNANIFGVMLWKFWCQGFYKIEQWKCHKYFGILKYKFWHFGFIKLTPGTYVLCSLISRLVLSWIWWKRLNFVPFLFLGPDKSFPSTLSQPFALPCAWLRHEIRNEFVFLRLNKILSLLFFLFL